GARRDDRRRLAPVAPLQLVETGHRLLVERATEPVDTVRRQQHRLPGPKRGYRVHRPSTTRSLPARSCVIATSAEPSSAAATSWARPSWTSRTSQPSRTPRAASTRASV